MALAISMAWTVNIQAYTMDFLDTTLSATWWQHAPTGDPLIDSVGGDPFQITGSRVTWIGSNVTIETYGKYPLAGTSDSGVADFFFLNPDMTAKYGIYMSGANKGKLVSAVSVNTPEFYFGDNPEFEYSNQYWDGSLLRTGMATIASGVDTGVTAVVSETLLGGIYTWQIFLPGINASGAWNDFAYLASAGLCNNDVLVAAEAHNVPVPSTILLFASGLLGLGFRFLEKRRRQNKQERHNRRSP